MGRRSETTVKVRELEPGTVVKLRLASHALDRAELAVVRVERAADVFERCRGEVAKGKSRVAIADAARGVVAAFEAMDYEGREARLVYFAGQAEPRRFASGDELPYAGFNSAAAREGRGA